MKKENYKPTYNRRGNPRIERRVLADRWSRRSDPAAGGKDGIVHETIVHETKAGRDVDYRNAGPLHQGVRRLSHGADDRSRTDTSHCPEARWIFVCSRGGYRVRGGAVRLAIV